MRLSENFWLDEFTKSQTALRNGIDNSASWRIRTNLKELAQNVLQPVRDHFGKAVRISSGYRCQELNRLIGSKDTSQHIDGKAVDFEIYGFSNKEVAEWIRDNVEFDQLILEMYDLNEGPNSGWIHVSYCFWDNRHEVLTYLRNGTFLNGI